MSDKQTYNRAYYAYLRDLKAGKPSPTALARLGREPEQRGPVSTRHTEEQIAALHQRWVRQRPRVSLAALAEEVGVTRQRLYQLFVQRSERSERLQHATQHTEKL